MKDKILFVTKGGENCDEGFSYVLELAKTLNTGIDVLIIYPGKMMSTFEDIMVAAAYAEAGDFNMIESMMEAEHKKIKDQVEQKIKDIISRSMENSIAATYHIAEGDVASIIKNYLKTRPAIDMVLFSPNLSGNKKYVDIKKLTRNISKPIVNISRPLGTEI